MNTSRRSVISKHYLVSMLQPSVNYLSRYQIKVIQFIFPRNWPPNSGPSGDDPTEISIGSASIEITFEPHYENPAFCICKKEKKKKKRHMSAALPHRFIREFAFHCINITISLYLKAEI